MVETIPLVRILDAYRSRENPVYAYMTKAEQADVICDLISAFGTGITDFKFVDIELEQIAGGLPLALQ